MSGTECATRRRVVRLKPAATIRAMDQLAGRVRSHQRRAQVDPAYLVSLIRLARVLVDAAELEREAVR